MKRLLVCAVLLLESACAVYHPLALDRRAKAPDALTDMSVDAHALAFVPHHHVFDPSHGLDMTDVAMLAVTNDPQLKLARDARDIGTAQAFAAGLLPDPVLDLSRVLCPSVPATSSASGVGLSYDFSALLTHALAKRASAESRRAVNLTLLWREWQVVGASGELFTRTWYGQRELARSRDIVRRLQKVERALSKAHRHGDASLAALDVEQSLLQTMRTRRDRIAQLELASRERLDALLGLSPRVKLRLRDPTRTAALSPARIAADLDELPRRRPDLLALQAGYRSENARYRQAIWQQFPAIVVGLTRARGTDSVTSRGLTVALTLPVFSRNRGRIAVARATRRALHDAYTARLIAARSGVQFIVQDEHLLEQRRRDLAAAVRIAARTLRALQTHVVRGDVSLADAQPAALALYGQQIELLRVEARIEEQQISLRTLLGEWDAHGHKGVRATPP